MDFFEKFKGEDDSHESDERWIISYADFITTLFALFVLLFALSIEKMRLKTGLESVARMVGARPLMEGIRPGEAQGLNQPRPREIQKFKLPSQGSAGAGSPEFQPAVEQGFAQLDLAELEKIKDKLAHDLQAFSNSGVSLKLTRDGLVISLAAARFFRSGQAEIDPAQEPVLKAVIENIGSLKNPMRIEGFTDSVPIHNPRFTDNWDLSAERAGNVLRYLLEHSSLAPIQLSLAGYGPYRPVASNDSEEGRALNRRVDIVVQPKPNF